MEQSASGEDECSSAGKDAHVMETDMSLPHSKEPTK